MPKIFCLLVSALLAVGAVRADEPLSPEAVEEQGAVIGDIVLEKHNIFDLDNPDENKWLYRWANRLHVVTRDDVIRKQLLIKEGEPFSARLLEESERVLRQNDYLWDVSLDVVEVEDGKAKINVMTRDVWTFLPDISVSRSGGENRTKFGIEDTNLLGRGQTLRVARIDTVDRTSNRFEFADRHLGRSWVSAFLRIADNSDGRSNILSLTRPFIQLDSRWSAGLRIVDDERRTALYSLGDEAAEFQSQTDQATIFGGWSAGLKNGWVRRWTAGVVYDENKFTAVPEPVLPQLVPENRRLVYPFIGIEILEDKFEKSENRNQIGRTEDFYLGTRLQATLGYAAESFGSDRDAVVFNSAASKGFGSLTKKALLLAGNASSRIEDGDLVNTRLDLSVDYFHRQSEKRVFFVSASGTYGKDLDLDNPVQLGGKSGLRGYPLRYQNGDSKVLFTVEQRYFTDWYPWRLFRVGGAIFFDAGRSFGDNPLEETDEGWLRDVGIGLRLAPTRGGTTKIAHIDLAFPLDGDASIDDVQILLEAKRGF